MRNVPIGFTVSPYLTDMDWERWTQDMNALQKFGATSIRCGISPWDTEEDRLTHIRRCLEDAKSRGLSVMLTCSQLVDGYGSTDEAALDAQTPGLIQGAVDYVGKVVDAVGDLVTWWQIANEHDARDWRNWGRTLWDEAAVAAAPEDQKISTERQRVYMTPHYLESLRDVISQCRTRIKSKYPNIIVHTATTGVGANTDSEMIWRRFYDVVHPAVDAIGINLYPITWWEKYEEMPPRLRRISRRYDLPVLITEIGLPSLSTPSEIEHGEWIGHQIDRGTRSSDVHGLWLYQLRDAGISTDPEYSTNAENRFGILTYDPTHPEGGVEKIYAGTVRTMIRSITT